jgi:hypothetical protein
VIRRAIVGLALVAATVACDYRHDLGDVAAEAETSDSSDSCDAFEPPAGDCTMAETRCLADSECAPGQSCNDFYGRCFTVGADCVGTQCSFDDDCGAGARCNSTIGICFDLGTSQRCMPCIGLSDCGPHDQCDVWTGRCVAAE